MRQTRQNTQIQTNQASAEEQFAAITTAAHAEALQVVDDLLSDDDSVDYSPTEQQTTAQIEVQQPTTEPLDNKETSTNSPDSATDSSLDTVSIKVIQPSIEGLEIRRPDNPPPRVPPTIPQSP